MDPVSAGILALQGVGTALQVQGIKHEAKAAQRSAAFNIKEIRKSGLREATQIRRAGRKLQGKNIAIVGASGATLEGSPLLAIAESAENVERQALQARINAETEAKLQALGAKGARRAGSIRTASALFSGASRIIDAGNRLKVF